MYQIKQNILITGSAGYVGASFAYYAKQQGFNPVCIDFLKNGQYAFTEGFTFYNCCIDESEKIKYILKKHQISVIFHFSAYIEVGESVVDPIKYYENNTSKTIQFLKTAMECDIKSFIFSSTAAIYGMPEKCPIDETQPKKPINPYGKSKLLVEEILVDLSQYKNFKYVALRYFNVAGCIPGSNIGEARRVETHLVPLVLDTVIGERSKICVFGTDFPTKDGTCIRDYIHIEDLCEAHLLAMYHVQKTQQSDAFNLGTSQGNSVLEVIELTKKIVGQNFNVVMEGRRAGDPAVLVASSEKFHKTTGWTPKHDLESIIKTAYEWRKIMHSYLQKHNDFNLERLKLLHQQTFFIDNENNKNQFQLFFAPGRINIVGEHTDYTGGIVLPAAINKGTYILAKKNNTNKVRAYSTNFSGGIREFNLKNQSFQKHNDWTDYFFGSYYILQQKEKFQESNQYGFDAIIFGDCPLSAGLSSSASIEIASIITFIGMSDIKIPEPGSDGMKQLCLLAQKCEHECAGVNCGIMDQFASGNGKTSTAIMLQCQQLKFKYTKMDLGPYSIILVNTNKPRNLIESKYNERVAECKQGYETIKGKLEDNTQCLGDISVEQWLKIKNSLDDNKIVQKRINHVINENDRVMKAFSLLAEGKILEVGQILNESGDSLRDDFEVTGTHLDTLVKLARKCDGVIGSRMMGAGFGGCTINIIKNDSQIIENFKQFVGKEYQAQIGIKPDFYQFEIGEGAREIQIN